jgi:two-component system, OmpR family, sensor kinase
MTVPLRARFALLAAVLVLLVASLVGLSGYLTLRASLLSRAARTARTEASRLVGLVGAGESGQGQIVDITDSSLTHQLPTPGLRVEVDRPGGLVIQSTPPAGSHRAVPIPAGVRTRCVAGGRAEARVSVPPLAVACARVGSGRAPLATIAVGVPLQDSLASLAALRRASLLGVLGGGLLAAVLALVLARRALAPLKRIARTADTIRSGDLGRRIGYGSQDEVGQLADVLDACFAELEDAIERQRSFAADASHELKTPLAAVRANVELLRGWASVDTAARETALESLDQAARRASRLVADLLELVRLDREPARQLTPTRLDEVVLQAVREAAPLRREVAIRVEQLDDVTVTGDPIGLQQLLLNVLDNALKASSPGGELTVALAATVDRARVTVSDAGPGIEPGELERIFDRFYTRRTGEGSGVGAGLGLAIARSIAREHGGGLTARNNAGAGAAFVLSLPVRSAGTGARDRGAAVAVP